MITISDASPNDIPLIQELAEKTWWPTYSGIVSDKQIRFMLDTIYSSDALTKAMTSGHQQFILVRDDQGAQGFAAYGLRPENTSVAKLHKIYVLPHNQGKGYGKLLLDEIRSRLLRDDIRTLDLNVNRHNKARYFYEKVGFAVIAEEDVSIGPYFMNDFIMRLTF